MPAPLTKILTVTSVLLWLATGVLGAFDWSEAAWLALGLAGAGSLACVVIRLRAMSIAISDHATRLQHRLDVRTEEMFRLKRIGTRTVHLAQRQQSLKLDVKALRSEIVAQRSAMDAHRAESGADRENIAKLSRDLYQVLVAVQRTPSTTQELGRLYDKYVHHDHPMPELGDWAMTPSTLIWIVDRIASTPMRSILECGSGSSTVWFAAALEARGGEGHVVSLESSAEFAAQTREQLERAGLAHRATVLHAPLVETTLPGRDPQPWFDTSGLPDGLSDIDLLFVDGPVGGIAHEARFPAFPLLSDRLSPDAIVVLDDTVRPDEMQIAEQWQHAPGRHVELLARMDRALAFTVADS